MWSVCALGLFVDGYDLYISSVAEPFITQLYHPSPFIIGLTQAVAPIGATIGAIVIGTIADRIGRKSLLICNLFFFVILALLSACAWSSTSLCVFRFLIGFGVGADYPICAAYLAEMLPQDKSDRLMAAAMFINCFASPLAVLSAWYIFKLYPNIHAWRWMFASGAVPALIGLALRAKLPESFIWKATRALQTNVNLSFITHYHKLFSTQFIRITLCLAFCWFFQDISYYAIILLTPYLLNALQIHSDVNFLQATSNLLITTIFINLFVLLGASAAIFGIKKLSPLVMQKIGFGFAFLGLVILSVSFLSTYNLIVILIGFFIYNFFINFGPGITTYLLPTKFYPPEIKATGHGFATGVGKLGAFIGATFLPLLQSNIGIHLTFGLLSMSLLLGLVLTYFLNEEEFLGIANNSGLIQPSFSLATVSRE